MTVLDNPYNPLQPAGEQTFFGREDAFAFFRQHLVGTQHRHALVLIGRRGLGKTSILYRLRSGLDDRYRLCMVPLGALDLTGEDVLIAALVDEIRLTLEEAEASTYRLPAWPEPSEGGEAVNLRAWFDREYLDVALTALRHRRLLLVLDDAHLLFQEIQQGTLPADLLDVFAQWMADHPRLDLLFALDAAYEDEALGVDLLSDPTLHFRLGDLGSAEAERLIRQPVQDVLRYESGVVEQILALAGGHPFLLQSICRLLFRRSEERNHAGPITDLDLTAVYPAVLVQAEDVFAPLWGGASPNERLALAALVALRDQAPGESMAFDAIYDWLVAHRYNLNKTQLAAALRSLDYKGLIHTRTDGTYQFPAALIPGWIKANTAVPAEIPAPRAAGRARLVPVLGLVIVLLAVAALGAAALSGAFGSDGEGSADVTAPRPTATLSLNLEATRQSDFATQTEQARPTRTPPPTVTLTRTPTASATSSPTRTPRPTITTSATTTPRPSATSSPTPTATRTQVPTNTPRPTRTATLASGM